MRQPSRKQSSHSTTKKPAKKNQLRIIGGRWRGRKLAIADVDGLRPSGDRIRETLFNWLAPDLPNAHCLDCFAGTGALGLECLSRGAASAYFLEKNPLAAKTLKQHLATLAADNGKLMQQDCLQWLNNPKPTEEHTIDIVFIDPPFAANLWNNTIHALEQSQRLANHAIIYIESPKTTILNTPKHWVLHKEKQTGQVAYRLFMRQDHSVSLTD